MSPTPLHHPGASVPGPTNYTNWTYGADWKPDDEVLGYESAFPHLTILADALNTETPDTRHLDR